MKDSGSTARTLTPACRSRSNQVGSGCHWSCGGSSRQCTWVTTRSVPGMLTVKPRMPCSPGCAPVPRDTRLVGVVDGKVHTSSAELSDFTGENGGQQRCIAGQVGQQMPAQTVDQHDQDPIDLAGRLRQS